MAKQLHSFFSDQAAVQCRTEALHGYFSRNVLRDDQFVCKSQVECQASHNGHFYAGQLHHVGGHYDLSRNGKPFRVVIVGQEYGHADAPVSLEERHEMIATGSGLSSRFVSTPGFQARNPHMKGCTNALRLAFGLGLGSGHEDEFLSINGNAVHIFECFALVNFLLCSALSEDVGRLLEMRRPGAKHGRSTRTMQQNCASHFSETLKILAPTLVIAQGKGVRRWMQQALDLQSSAPATCVERIKIGTTDSVLVSLTHPSAHHPKNWGANACTPYLLKTVEPAIDEAVALMSGRRPLNLAG